MLSKNNIIRKLLLVVTLAGWGLFGFKLLIAGGIVPGTIQTTWSGLARRHAWAHWVSTNGSPTVRNGKAQFAAGDKFELAVQPISVCANLALTANPENHFTFTSKDRPNVLATEKGFTTKQLLRASDGYHFLIATATPQILTSLTFTCRP